MLDYNIILPSKPRIVSEEEFSGVYEIDGLYPGYGHTLGNSLRRIILSSIPGAAITSVKIKGVNHEFSTIDGVKEDTISILLNLKKVRFKISTDEPQILTLTSKGVGKVNAKDLKLPGQVEILNKDLYIADLTAKNANLEIEMVVEKGLGYLSKESLQKDKVDIGTITLDAIFTPVRRVNYEVEDMRVGDRTDHNRLRIFIETDGSILPREALEKSIETMIHQLKAIIGFKEEVIEEEIEEIEEIKDVEKIVDNDSTEFLKTRVENLNLSARTIHSLDEANIRTVGGLAKKKEEDLLSLEGLGKKGIQEIKRALSNFGITLK